ncbi:hypothetical protein RTG_03042 [Rhodotorula toruloides ATCC 204091]|uniref:Zinc finger C2H2 LYAR-type domain-containing protein n=1 Tax=Rhodotorula toruloides TaxID=5286 RepID=A0A0K3CB74_RHOTO|nr:hypothetical protein RTG_03042 [Rhodotorula toruloides ATCC 204091]
MEQIKLVRTAKDAVSEGIDCNTTFEGTSYRSHTSCITEEEKYQKSVYKPPKGKKGKQQQQGQQQQGQQEQKKEEQPVASTSTAKPAAPAPEVNGNVKPEKKRAREEEKSEAKVEEKQSEEKDGATAEDEPAKKKKKKSKKSKDAAAPTDDSAAAAAAPEPATNGTSAPSLTSFLTDFVTPLLKADVNVSLASLRQKVVEAAKEKGVKESEKDVEAKLWEGLKVGGKKGKVRIEFA